MLQADKWLLKHFSILFTFDDMENSIKENIAESHCKPDYSHVAGGVFINIDTYWQLFCRRHSNFHFSLNFSSHSSTGSDDGLKPNRRKAVIWIKSGLVHCRLYASLDHVWWFKRLQREFNLLSEFCQQCHNVITKRNLTWRFVIIQTGILYASENAVQILISRGLLTVCGFEYS